MPLEENLIFLPLALAGVLTCLLAPWPASSSPQPASSLASDQVRFAMAGAPPSAPSVVSGRTWGPGARCGVVRWGEVRRNDEEQYRQVVARCGEVVVKWWRGGGVVV